MIYVDLCLLSGQKVRDFSPARPLFLKLVIQSWQLFIGPIWLGCFFVAERRVIDKSLTALLRRSVFVEEFRIHAAGNLIPIHFLAQVHQFTEVGIFLSE